MVFFFTPPILVILNRDTLIVAFGNCLTSVFAGFVIFSYLGYLANYMDLPVGDVAKSGPSLTFVVYPFAVTKMPISPLWAILFFIMLITLGVDSEVSRYFLLLYTQIFLPVFPPFFFYRKLISPDLKSYLRVYFSFQRQSSSQILAFFSRTQK